jgi:hypothetical protein
MEVSGYLEAQAVLHLEEGTPRANHWTLHRWPGRGDEGEKDLSLPGTEHRPPSHLFILAELRDLHNLVYGIFSLENNFVTNLFL